MNNVPAANSPTSETVRNVATFVQAQLNGPNHQLAQAIVDQAAANTIAWKIYGQPFPMDDIVHKAGLDLATVAGSDDANAKAFAADLVGVVRAETTASSIADLKPQRRAVVDYAAIRRTTDFLSRQLVLHPAQENPYVIELIQAAVALADLEKQIKRFNNKGSNRNRNLIHRAEAATAIGATGLGIAVVAGVTDNVPAQAAGTALWYMGWIGLIGTGITKYHDRDAQKVVTEAMSRFESAFVNLTTAAGLTPEQTAAFGRDLHHTIHSSLGRENLEAIVEPITPSIHQTHGLI